MKLFIVGNGFDLNFGLRTKLSDFGEYLRVNEQDIFYTLRGLHGLSGTPDDFSDLQQWNHLETRMANFDESFIIDEAQYSFDRQEAYPPPSDNFWAYAADHFDDLVNPIIHELPRLVREWALNIDTSDASDENIEAYERFGQRNQGAAFLTFNYTRVLQDVCDLQNVFHVHGEAEAGDVVIGHSAQFVRAAVKLGDINEISELYGGFETYNDHFRKRQDDLFNGVSEFLSNAMSHRRVDEVVACGHSIGDADRGYFLSISHLVPNAIWTFTPFGGSGSQDHVNVAGLTSDTSFFPTVTAFDVL